MNNVFKSIAAITLGLATTAAMAVPSALVTHNQTNVESNAIIAGSPSPYPTAAHTTNSIGWLLVRIACYGHTVNDECAATIVMDSNSAHPIELGEVKLNLVTGEITPAVISNNGYTMTVIGEGETMLTED